MISAPERAWCLMGPDGTPGSIFGTRSDARAAQAYSLVQPNRVTKVRTVSWHGEPMVMLDQKPWRPVTRLKDFKTVGPVRVGRGRRAVTVLITSITPVFGWRAKTALYEGILWPVGW